MFIKHKSLMIKEIKSLIRDIVGILSKQDQMYEE